MSPSRRNRRSTPSSGRRAPVAGPLSGMCVPPQARIPTVVVSRPTWHPNVYRKRIWRVFGYPQPGDWVAVAARDGDSANRGAEGDGPGVSGADPDGDTTATKGQAATTPTIMGQSSAGERSPKVFGFGWYNPKSEIAVRIARWGTQPPGETFWQQILQRAVALRCDSLRLDSVTDCYRVIHAEADGIPGLVIDRYADVLSAEVFSMAAGLRAIEILGRLQEMLGTPHWLIQPAPHLLSQEGVEVPRQQSSDLPRRVTIREHDWKFHVDFSTGHKTGFFCDQRDNRRRLQQWCEGKEVLDLCCYTGGFSVAAARGGASSVVGVDLDAEPLELARKNAALNDVKIKFTQADAFGYMRDMLRGGRQFDVVVLDPPKLIRNRAELDEGTRKHFDLNRLAVQLVRPGGLLLTCSCAGLLAERDFLRLLYAAVRSAEQPTAWNPDPPVRSAQVLARTGAAPCHPIAARCPETEYLKAVWMRL